MGLVRRLVWLLAAAVPATAILAAGLIVFRLRWDPPVPLGEPQLLSRTPRGPRASVVLGGDFAPTDAAMPAIREHGWRYPYLGTADLLRDADLAFANLESPVTESLEPFPLPRDYVYRVEPEATAAWGWLGLDLVSLANNHIMDYRARGVLDTVRHLDGAGIAHVGAGADATAARRPVIADLGGVRVGFLAYLEDQPGYAVYLGIFAAGDRVGAARLTERDLEEDVRRLRPRCDVLVVSVHWGENYQAVTPGQRRFARRMAALGVDVVAGHHPHDVQPVELIGQTIVLYSLGNYAWGAPGHDHLRIGLLARLELDREARTIATLELVPIATQNDIVAFQPRLLHPREVSWIEPFLAASRRTGTSLALVDGRVIVELPREANEPQNR